MANRVVHFEIEAENVERAKKFYSQAFGWEMEQMGEEYGNYVVVKTGDPKEPMGINGGIYQKQQEKPKEVNAYRCVVGVNDIQQAMADVKTAGGMVLNEPQNIPNVGLSVGCKDTEENYFTLLQPSGDMQPK